MKYRKGKGWYKKDFDTGEEKNNDKLFYILTFVNSKNYFVAGLPWKASDTF